MIFRRSQPPQYRDYHSYKQILREDFQFRCAYCLTHEFFLGGEAGCVIDHHRPIRGKYGRPDLASVYTNLYLGCDECNEDKSDTWPSEEEYARGERFIDPCEEWGDHDLHWQIETDGTLTPLTPEGRYTNDVLMLWRDSLVDRRAQQFRDQEEFRALQAELDTANLPDNIKTILQARLTDIVKRLEPPVFHRPRRK
jgi:hypothetical protein